MISIFILVLIAYSPIRISGFSSPSLLSKKCKNYFSRVILSRHLVRKVLPSENSSGETCVSCNEKYFIETVGWGKFQDNLSFKLGLTYAWIAMDTILPAYLIPSLTNAWKLTAVQQGYIGSVWFLGGLFGYSLAGLCNRSLGPRKLLVYSSMVRSLSTVSLYLSPSLHWILAFRAISSAAAAISFNNIFVFLFEYCPKSDFAACKQRFSFIWNSGLIFIAIAEYLLR